MGVLRTFSRYACTLVLCGISSVTYHGTGGTRSVAKRLECAQLAAAMGRPSIIESGSKLLILTQKIYC